MGSVAFHHEHKHSIEALFQPEPPTRNLQLSIPFSFDGNDMDGAQIATILLSALANQGPFSGANLSVTTLQADQKTLEVMLANGSDGIRPRPSNYEGDDTDPKRKTGLKSLEDIQDISIVAAPGHTVWPNAPDPATATLWSQTVANLLISHSEFMRYRIAVLDSIEGQALPDIRAYRSQLDSTRAAIYYPFIRILDPVTQTEINLPPSGFVTGIYARSDVTNGVHKSPANEVILGALGFEVTINKGQQDVLNPEHQLLRFFEGRGNCVGRAHHHLRSGRRSQRRRQLSSSSARSIATRWRPEQRRRAVSQHLPHDRDFLQRWKLAPLRRRKKCSCVAIADDDAERLRQRSPGLPHRRLAAQAGRIRHLPHRPETADATSDH